MSGRLQAVRGAALYRQRRAANLARDLIAYRLSRAHESGRHSTGGHVAGLARTT